MEALKMSFNYDLVSCLSDEEFKDLMNYVLLKTRAKMEIDKLNSLISDKVAKDNI
jgi:hypothetical protein